MTCELVSEMNAKSIEGDIRQVNDNQYEISYQATTAGRHQLHIKFDGKHIKASPFAVMVKGQSKNWKLQSRPSLD